MTAEQTTVRPDLETEDRSLGIVRVTAAALCTFGAAVVIHAFFGYLLVFPGPALLAIAAEIPLLVAGFLLLRLLRPVRSPPLVWSAAATIWGASAAIGCALIANQGLTGLWAKTAGISFASHWSNSLSAPLNEEVFKVCGVIMIVLAAPGLIKGPLDGLVFGALTGLGFQVVENITYGLDNIVQSGATDPTRAVLNSFAVRLSTAVGSHWAMTAVAGAGIGYLVAFGRSRRGITRAAGCLAAAMAMHLFFDAPHPAIGIKVAVNFVIAGVLYLVLADSYLHRAGVVLARYATAGTIKPDEASTLISRRCRQRELRLAGDGATRTVARARQQAILASVENEAG